MTPSEGLLPNSKNKQKIIAIFLLLFFVFVFPFIFQGKRGLWSPDEGYYVGTACTMAERGDLLVPRLGEAIFLDKPPLTYWGIIAGIDLFGQNEFGARAFHALFFGFTVLVVGILGYNLFGDKRSGFLAGIIYATMILPFIAANFVTPDSPLILWTTLSMLFFWKSVMSSGKKAQLWKILMSAALGFGFLTKGPAVLLPCAAMLVFLIVRRQVVPFFFTWWFLICIFTFALIGLSWYFWVALKVPGAGAYFFDNQVWGRLVSNKYNRNPGLRGALIYIPVLLLGTLPWTYVWWRKVGEMKSKVMAKRWWLNLKDRPDILFLLTWFFIPVVLLCLASSKLGFYALPVFPAVALGTVRFWKERLSFNYSNPLARENHRPLLLMGCLVLALVSSKAILSYYPIKKNIKELYLSLIEHLPRSDYEIVAVDDHVDGLIFYGVPEVENITLKTKPYTFFSSPEHLRLEIKEIIKIKERVLFLAKDSDQATVLKSLLSQADLNFTEVRLPYNRHLLIHE